MEARDFGVEAVCVCVCVCVCVYACVCVCARPNIFMECRSIRTELEGSWGMPPRENLSFLVIQGCI